MKHKSMTALLGLAAMTGVSAEADTIELVGVVRDFKIDHPDMQHAHKSFGVKTGVVAENLDADGKPELREGYDPSNAMIESAESLEQWFRDVPGVNIAWPHSIVLDNGQDEPGGVYTFAREKGMSGDLQYFFPADGKGWNDDQTVNTGTHNFYFTYEVQTTFTYVDPAERDWGMEFKFVGDDDVWVFINGKLAVDIGGVHGQASGEIDVDAKAEELGLEPGEDYDLVLFFAERHTTQSNFRIETTMQLQRVEPTNISPLFD